MSRRLYSTIFLFLSLLFISSSLPAKLTSSVRTFPSLPFMQREAKFEEARKAFEDRSNLLLKGKHFENWKMNKAKNEIENEFKRIEEWRTHSWYDNSGNLLVSRPDFMISQELLDKGYFRRPHIIAFDYNQTNGNYNSSNIIINNQKFLALEAPTQETVNQFFKLLQNFQVSQLVNLVGTDEQGQTQSFSYWENRLGPSKVLNTSSAIHIPLLGTLDATFPIHYYPLNHWEDNMGIEAKTLLTLIKQVRKNYDPDQGLLACHCRSGVGRTGTFIAGFVLIQEIDRQIASGVKPENIEISIEKVVMQLSLQRFNMVARSAQYVTLYRLVDHYMQTLKVDNQGKR